MPVFYINFEHPEPSFKEWFESSAFSNEAERINICCDELKIKNIFELFSYTPQNSLCPPGYEEKEVPWFEAEEGLQWIDTVLPKLIEKALTLEDAPKLFADFRRFRDVLVKAKASGKRWHFEMDM